VHPEVVLLADFGSEQLHGAKVHHPDEVPKQKAPPFDGRRSLKLSNTE